MEIHQRVVNDARLDMSRVDYPRDDEQRYSLPADEEDESTTYIGWISRRQ